MLNCVSQCAAVTPTVCPMSFASRMCAKKFAEQTVIVDPMKFAKEFSVSRDVGHTPIVLIRRLARTANALVTQIGKLQPSNQN